MGFTTEARGQSIKYGANCVLLKTQYAVVGQGQSPYVQVSPQQIQALQYQQYQAGQYQLTPQYAADQYQTTRYQTSKHPTDWVDIAPSSSSSLHQNPYFNRPLIY